MRIGFQFRDYKGQVVTIQSAYGEVPYISTNEDEASHFVEMSHILGNEFFIECVYCKIR